MGERRPTPEQRAAIDSDRRSVLVEAGAGSGKTGVMVDRYVRLVCDQGISPDTVLAFTFTDKAAAELRQRVRAAIGARAAAGSERAGELLPALGSAWVTTIHGFCNRILSAHPVAAGVDPRFRVLDAAEAERAAAEAFDGALEAFLASRDPERETLVATFDIAGLRAIATGAYAELRSRGIVEARLPEPPPSDLAGALRRAVEAAETALAELQPGSNRELAERALDALGTAGAEPPDLDTVASLRTTSRAKALAPYREAVEELLSRTAEAGEGGRSYRHLAELLGLFAERFAATKERRAGVDFEDLQILAVRMLERTEVGASYRGRFSHLLVDEFQDTNRLQLRLVEALRGPASALMVVGDELQSIYGFRHADLDVFREQRAAIGASADGEVLALSGNFRSRPEVIGAVNAIGSKLLGDSFKPLRAGAAAQPAPVGGDPAVELLLTGRDGWDEEGIDLEPATDARTRPSHLAEARFLAARLRELVDAGVERGAMVVLLRAYTHLDAYEDSLERAGLRPYVVGGRGYWSQQQVADVCALLATIANPLDDQALFGALASPACGVAPDTLWLLRAATGRGRHVWPAAAHLARADGDRPELAEPELLEAIPAAEGELLRRFVGRVEGLRRRAQLLSLPELIEAAVAETGYDLAILMRTGGEARLANVRKLARLASEFEAAEGRDLRGLLDFLAARAGADADPQAATAVEGHDGIRIMTIHSAKGLEFDVVAVPCLSRGLLAAARTPPLMLGHEADSPRVGVQLRRLGAGSVNLYAYRELREEAREREAEEELRLFHVAATRARQRLILSGVIRPTPGNGSAGTSVVERVAGAFELDRGSDSTLTIPGPEPRPGLEAAFPPVEVAVRLNLASPQRAAELTTTRRDPESALDPGEGPAPLLERRPPPTPNVPLSYTAIDERLGAHRERGAAGDPEARDGAAVRGVAVHAMLEWSQAHDWEEPPPGSIRQFLRDAEEEAGALPGTAGEPDQLLVPFRAWTGSELFAGRVRGATRTRAEVPLLLQLAGTVMRGSIDLLAEGEGDPPLVVDYKTDRVGAADLAEWAERYETQRDLYALAVGEALGCERVEVAYVFLERPHEPALSSFGRAEIEAGRRRLEAKVDRIREAGALVLA